MNACVCVHTSEYSALETLTRDDLPVSFSAYFAFELHIYTGVELHWTILMSYL